MSARTSGARPGRWPDVPVPQLPWRGGKVLDRAGLVVVAAVAVVLRVVQRSPLWLDEALSANIAALPIGDIPGALEHDGHPPLYYVVLHVWQDVVGTGDVAVRLLSGLVGLLLVPLAATAAGRVGGRRAAWATAVLVASNPFVIRYSTEARMYEIVMVLAIGGWLVADAALRRLDPVRLVLLAVLTGALLWTHYWGIWLTAASALGLVVRGAQAHLSGDAERRRTTLSVLASLVAGCLMFLPWVPTLLYQSARTGTPWAEPSVPTEVAALSLLDLGGGNAGESVLLAVGLALLVALGLFGRPGDGTIVTLDLRTRPEVRRMALVVVVTLGVATFASLVAGAAYATRYFAVVAPLVLVLAGVGASRIGGPVALRLVLVAALLLGTVSATRSAVSRPRSQSREVAAAIEAHSATDGADPLVVVCPDQLGPALGRELGPDADLVAYPDLSDPALIDWVDYSERLEGVDLVGVADAVLDRAGDRPIWVVWSGTYKTHQGTCEALVNEIHRVRPGGAPVVLGDSTAFEQANAHLFPA